MICGGRTDRQRIPGDREPGAAVEPPRLEVSRHGRRGRPGLAVMAITAVVAVAACHQEPAPSSPRPRGPTACARASDSIVLAMLARLPSGEPPPTETADALRNLIRERCERDGWSADATRCLAAMQRVDDAAPCATLLTDAQQAALAHDEEARLGAAAHGDGSSGNRRGDPGRSTDAPARNSE